MLLFFTNNVFALRCELKSNGFTQETDSVGEVLIPKDSQNGQIIWQSNLITRTVKCYDASPPNAEGELVYFYYFPEDKLTLPRGMTFGIIYNGNAKDLDLSSTVKERRFATDIWVAHNGESSNVDEETVIKDFSFQFYIRKTGDINSRGFFGRLPIFQLDGVGGVNASAPNYKYNLTALNNISDVFCSFTYKKEIFQYRYH